MALQGLDCAYALHGSRGGTVCGVGAECMHMGALVAACEITEMAKFPRAETSKRGFASLVVSPLFVCPPEGGAYFRSHKTEFTHSLTRFAESWIWWWFRRVGWGQGAWAKGGGRKTKANNEMN